MVAGGGNGELDPNGAISDAGAGTGTVQQDIVGLKRQREVQLGYGAVQMKAYSEVYLATAVGRDIGLALDPGGAGGGRHGKRKQRKQGEEQGEVSETTHESPPPFDRFRVFHSNTLPRKKQESRAFRTSFILRGRGKGV